MYKKITILFLSIFLLGGLVGGSVFAEGGATQDLQDRIEESTMYLSSQSDFLSNIEKKITDAVKNKNDRSRGMAEAQVKQYLLALDNKSFYLEEMNKVLNAEINKMNEQIKAGDQNYHKSEQFAKLQSRIDRSIKALDREKKFILEFIDKKSKILNDKDIEKSYEQAVVAKAEAEDFIEKMKEQYGDDFALGQEFSDALREIANDLQMKIEAKLPAPKVSKEDEQKEYDQKSIEKTNPSKAESEQSLSRRLLAPQTGVSTQDLKLAAIVVSSALLMVISSLAIIKRF